MELMQFQQLTLKQLIQMLLATKRWTENLLDVSLEAVFNISLHLTSRISARQHPSYGDCLEVNMEYYQNCSVLGCVTQCSQSAAYSYEQFLQVQQIRFITLGPLRHAYRRLPRVVLL